jgi:hypothetical protein
MMTLSIKARTEIGYIMNSMAKLRSKTLFVPTNDASFRVKRRRNVPHEFVLETLSQLSARTNPMFGCLAVNVGEKIVLMLRDKREGTADNGIWLATTAEHQESLRREFPNMRATQIFAKKVTGWQVLPVDARIGKIPKERKGSGAARKRKGKLRGRLVE